MARVLLRRENNEIEAAITQGYLEGNSIHASIARTTYSRTSTLGTCDLYVEESDAQKAKELLQERDSQV